MPKRPSVTVFASPPSLYPVFIEHLEEQLPLRSVKWRDNAEKTHLIPELPLKIVRHRLGKPNGGGGAAAAATAAGAESAQRTGGTETFEEGDPVEEPDRPLVHIAVVQCEDSAAYRGHLKEQLAQWQQSLGTYTSSRNWLIININPKALPRGKHRLTLFDTVHDKIKADFGGKADGDRCLQLRNESGPVSAELWASFLGRLEDELLLSFNNRAGYVQKLIKSAAEAFNDLPEPSDSDFCIFFLLKDTLGRSFESFGLLKQAVVQYDELEIDFERYLDKGDTPRDGTAKTDRQWLNWFHDSCRTTCVQGAPIGVELDGANFRRHVRKKQAVVFEMRQYILHRQTTLLFSLGEPPEAAQRCLKLILQIVPEMYADWPAVRALFVRQWAILTCLDVIRCSEAYLQQAGRGLALTARVKYALVRANLAVYAKQRLEEIGLSGQLLPPTFLLGLRSEEHDPGSVEQDVALAAGEVMFPETIFSALRVMRTCGDLLPSLPTGIEKASKAAATAIQRASSSNSAVSPRRPKSREAKAPEEDTASDAPTVSRFTRRKSTRAFSIAAITSRPSLELLRDALLSTSAFDFLYMNLCQVAVDSFKQADRMRSSLGLFCDVATLHFCRSEWMDAVDQFAVAVRQFRKECWFTLEFRLLRPMIHCYEQVGAFDLVVDTILRILSEDCPPEHVEEQPLFAAKLLEYARFGAESVTCDADSTISVSSIEEIPASGVAKRKVTVHVRNNTATDLVFEGATLTYEETVSTPNALSESPDRKRGDAADSVFDLPQIAERDGFLVSEVDLLSPSRQMLRKASERDFDTSQADDTTPAASRKPSAAESEAGLDQLTEALFFDQSEARKCLNTRRTQAQRARDFSYRTDEDVILPAGTSTEISLRREGERYGGTFLPQTLVFLMGKVTLLSLRLPPCREGKGLWPLLDLEARLLATPPLIHGVETTIVVELTKLGDYHEADTMAISADAGLLFKLTGSADEMGSEVCGISLSSATDQITLTVLLGTPSSDSSAIDLSGVVAIQRGVTFTLTNMVTRPRDDATANIDLEFGVPLRAASEVRTLDGQTYVRVELQNLLSAELMLQKHRLNRHGSDVGKDWLESPEDLSGILQWPISVTAKQCISFVWRVPRQTTRRPLSLSRWPNVFSAEKHAFDAVFQLSLASRTEGPLLQFGHKSEYIEPIFRFAADIAPQLSEGNTVPKVGEFSRYYLHVSWETSVEFVEDEAEPINVTPVALTYSLVVDSKRWMCSGQIRGDFDVHPNERGTTGQHSILLLPLVSGLLHLPTVKVHCKQGDSVRKVHVVNQHRAHQIRVFPRTSKPSTTRLSVY